MPDGIPVKTKTHDMAFGGLSAQFPSASTYSYQIGQTMHALTLQASALVSEAPW
jgi:hypothetical protein